MVRSVLTHADDPLWEEVILLAAAHPDLSSQRRDLLLQRMSGRASRSRRPMRRGRRRRLPLARRETIKAELHARMGTPASRRKTVTRPAKPGTSWAACRGPRCLGDLPEVCRWRRRLAPPNTGHQRPIRALRRGQGGLPNPGGGGRGKPRLALADAEHNIRGGQGPVTQPEYWNNLRFGKDRRGYPVVGCRGTRPRHMPRG